MPTAKRRRRRKPPPISEADFQTQVLGYAKLRGWEHMHVRKSVVRDGKWATATSVAGWPDLTMWREDDRIIYVELKSQRGVQSEDQAEVARSLRAAGAEFYVWRPSDWDLVTRVLK